MAQNNNVLIGIVVVIIIGTGLYFYMTGQSNIDTTNPTPTNNTTSTFQTLMANAQLGTSDYGANMETIVGLSDTDLAAQVETFSTYQAENTETKMIVDIYLLAMRSTQYQRSVVSFSQVIEQGGIGQICTHLSDMTQRDQADLAGISAQEQLNLKLQSYQTAYPHSTLLTNISLSSTDFDSQRAQITNSQSVTVKLQNSCTGITA